MSLKTFLVVLLAVVVMTVTWAFYAFFAREVTHWMEGKHHWFHDYEPWSLAGFIAVFITATALFLPAQPFVVATGYLFGFHFLTILFTVAVYALAAFLMFNGARYWFRPIAEDWLREHKVVHGMSQYVKDPREGAKLNLLFSFTPIAFCIHCYVMGVTEIDEFIFMPTFLMGQAPHIIFGLLTGSALLAADTNSSALDSFKIALLVLGVVGTFVAMLYLMHVAEKVLKDMDEDMARKKLLGEASRGERCGVGITFEEQDDSSLAVASIVSGSAAALSRKIKVGDVLYEIDGRNVYRAKIDVITRLIPGEMGTYVELGLKRGERDSPDPIFRVKLTRRHVKGLTPAKTYGTAQTQTPPHTPVEDSTSWSKKVRWEHPEVVVVGESTPIGEPIGEVEANQAGRPVYVAVASSTL